MATTTRIPLRVGCVDTTIQGVPVKGYWALGQVPLPNGQKVDVVAQAPTKDGAIQEMERRFKDVESLAEKVRAKIGCGCDGGQKKPVIVNPAPVIAGAPSRPRPPPPRKGAEAGYGQISMSEAPVQILGTPRTGYASGIPQTGFVPIPGT